MNNNLSSLDEELLKEYGDQLTDDQKEALGKKDDPCTELLDDNTILVHTLQTLVDLKEYKDEHGKDEYYLKNQPLAWDNAKEVLKGR